MTEKENIARKENILAKKKNILEDILKKEDILEDIIKDLEDILKDDESKNKDDESKNSDVLKNNKQPLVNGTSKSDLTPVNAAAFLYETITPLFSGLHKNWGLEKSGDFSFVAQNDSILITAEEFADAQAHYMIAFNIKGDGLPFVVTGIPSLGNQYVGNEGQWKEGCYVPAFVRRYPFMLAKINEDKDELSLCFDKNSSLIKDGGSQALFDQDKPTEVTNNILKFCESYEAATEKTLIFVKELQELDLLIVSNIQAQVPGQDPIVLDGFKVISEDKLKKLSKDQCSGLVKSGAMGLIYAHFFSLKNVEKLFIDRKKIQKTLSSRKCRNSTIRK